MNISSVVVKCAPQYLVEVRAALDDSEVGEIFAYDKDGRIILVLEGDSTECESEKLRAIQEMAHVLSAEMVYAYSESEFSAEEGMFERVSESLMQTLNSDIPAEEISYSGHLKD